MRSRALHFRLVVCFFAFTLLSSGSFAQDNPFSGHDGGDKPTKRPEVL
jgi:hypothetical protein